MGIKQDAEFFLILDGEGGVCMPEMMWDAAFQFEENAKRKAAHLTESFPSWGPHKVIKVRVVAEIT